MARRRQAVLLYRQHATREHTRLHKARHHVLNVSKALLLRTTPLSPAPKRPKAILCLDKAWLFRSLVHVEAFLARLALRPVRFVVLASGPRVLNLRAAKPFQVTLRQTAMERQ